MTIIIFGCRQAPTNHSNKSYSYNFVVDYGNTEDISFIHDGNPKRLIYMGWAKKYYSLYDNPGSIHLYI